MERSNDSNFGFALFVGNPAVGKVSLNGEHFTPCDLPNAAEEVKCLSKLFQATPLLGREARKQVVLQLLSGASIVHIAAHGEPKRGEIMLAPNSSQVQPYLSVPEPESYLLTQKDIMNVSVQASLVVLCCCHTGKGEITSEGVIGITRAFLAAGARSVLATLWPIDDNATKEFMGKFYGELCKETSVCESLRRTVNFFQKHEKEEYQSSRIWAPFTIYGEDVNFRKDEIESIREQSREMFSDFVILP
jgi:CHAT domain-containing protein